MKMENDGERELTTSGARNTRGDPIVRLTFWLSYNFYQKST